MDYPNSKKAKKFFLCLMMGGGTGLGAGKAERMEVPKGLTGEPEEDERDARVKFERSRAREGRGERGKKRRHPKESSKDWILRKKEVLTSPMRLASAPRHSFANSFLSRPALPSKRKRRRPSRLKIHRMETKICFLTKYNYVPEITTLKVYLYPCCTCDNVCVIGRPLDCRIVARLF